VTTTGGFGFGLGLGVVTTGFGVVTTGFGTSGTVGVVVVGVSG
jgi:hypothetical protein